MKELCRWKVLKEFKLDETIAKLKSEVIDIPMYINGNEITSSEKIKNSNTTQS